MSCRLPHKSFLKVLIQLDFKKHVRQKVTVLHGKKPSSTMAHLLILCPLSCSVSSLKTREPVLISFPLQHLVHGKHSIFASIMIPILYSTVPRQRLHLISSNYKMGISHLLDSYWRGKLMLNNILTFQNRFLLKSTKEGLPSNHLISIYTMSNSRCWQISQHKSFPSSSKDQTG